MHRPNFQSKINTDQVDVREESIDELLDHRLMTYKRYIRECFSQAQCHA